MNLSTSERNREAQISGGESKKVLLYANILEDITHKCLIQGAQNKQGSWKY